MKLITMSSFLLMKFIDSNTNEEIFTIKADINMDFLKDIVFLRHITNHYHDIVIKHGTYDGVVLALQIPYNDLAKAFLLIKEQIHDLDDLRKVVIKYTSLDIKKELGYKWYEP